MKGDTVRKVLALVVLVQALLVAGCSGGGSSGGSSSGGSSGGSSSGGTCCGNQVPITAGPPNVEPLVIDQGPAAVIAAGQAAIDTAFVTVQVCTDALKTICANIDHIQIDTGSTGLRIVAEALSGSATVTAVPGGPALLTALQKQYVKSGGSTVTECVEFAIGYSYGSLTTTDITLPTSTETASGVITQLIGDPNYSAAANVPNSCTNPPGVNPAPMGMNTVVSFGANGILGVGILPADTYGLYYACGPCNTATPPIMAPTANEMLQNPVTLFANDNNGTIVQLPAVSNAGTTSPTSPPGVIVFGIGTEANNTLGSATVLQLNTDPTLTNGPAITATVTGTIYNDSFIDSGTNFLAISGASVPAALTTCADAPDFYCTSATVNFTATLQGQMGNPPMGTGPIQNANFSIADADTLFNANGGVNTAVPNLGGPNGADPASVDFGLPFFFGRYVYTAIDCQSYVPPCAALPAGTPASPWFAY
jgi:hypothetical protein